MLKNSMLTVDRSEIYRYLGYRRQEPDEQIRGMVDECLASLLPQLELRQVHRFFDLEWTDPVTACIGDLQIRSRALSRNLQGCSQACLMAATIGLAVDRESRRAQVRGKTSQAVIIQAAGAALIEAWCDKVNEQIRQEAAARGMFLRPRFSPGYGDFPLACQTELFRLLQVSRHTGITLTESLMMMPSKSVTAVIGLSSSDTSCILSGCEACGRSGTCRFSRLYSRAIE